MNNFSISYSILTHNEINSLLRLIDFGILFLNIENVLSICNINIIIAICKNIQISAV